MRRKRKTIVKIQINGVFSNNYLDIRAHLTVMTCPAVRSMPFIWAMKIAATASYRAVPSMLTVAPTGSTNRVTRLSMPRFSSKHRKVTGSAAVLQTSLQLWTTSKLARSNRLDRPVGSTGRSNRSNQSYQSIHQVDLISRPNRSIGQSIRSVCIYRSIQPGPLWQLNFAKTA